MEEQILQDKVIDDNKGNIVISKSIQISYWLSVVGKILLITSYIFYFLLNVVFDIYYGNALEFPLYFNIAGWIITIPSVIVYKRKTKNKIGTLNWFLFTILFILPVLAYLSILKFGFYI
ncbi:hypothetical protein IID19_04125 [Patescibacteria group bacterium]|nr:hypothetical protein [Patescibacteria group bacterium]